MFEGGDNDKGHEGSMSRPDSATLPLEIAEEQRGDLAKVVAIVRHFDGPGTKLIHVVHECLPSRFVCTP